MATVLKNTLIKHNKYYNGQLKHFDDVSFVSFFLRIIVFALHNESWYLIFVSTIAINGYEIK